MTETAALMTSARLILLDFDGPIAHMFYGYPPYVLADDFRHYLRIVGVDLPSAPVNPGPFEVYRSALELRPDLAGAIETWLIAAETRAAKLAQPTPGCREVLVAANAAGKPVAIVSNNSEAAIHAYLERENITSHVARTTGRPYAAPERMKPSPWPILSTAKAFGFSPLDCVFVGDSVFDIEAANAADCPCIGYANKPGKTERLGDAGAIALIDDMHLLAGALCVPNLTAGG